MVRLSGEEPTCPKILCKVTLLPLIRQKAPTPGPGAPFPTLAQPSGLPRKLPMWRWVPKEGPRALRWVLLKEPKGS